MDMTQNVAEWLNWLSRVRFFLITLLLALVLVLGKTSQLEVSTRLFLPLMILWYTLAIIYAILMRWMPVASWHGPVQLVCGLLTTDLEGRILLLNWTGEEITGHKFSAVRGMLLQDLWPVFWLPGDTAVDGKLPQRREVDFLTPDGQ